MEKESPAASSLLSALTGWLNSSGLYKIGGAGMALAFAWALWHRGAVQMRPFEGAEGPMISLRLSRALEDVALGAMTDLDLEPAQFEVGETAPPPIVIPGTGLSFNTLVSFVQVGPLAPTSVHGTFAQEGKQAQFFLQIVGPNGVRAIVTEPKPTMDEAANEAAVQLYRTLRPAVAAAYLYRRDALLALDLVRETLSNPDCTSKDRATAFRIWGVILRDQRDFDGARAKFDESMQATRAWESASSRSRALTLVDIGHSYLWEQRWRSAMTYYQKALDLEPTWAAPLNYLGDASQGAGDLQTAIAYYKKAIDADPLYVEPWNGLGTAYASQGHYNEAIDAYLMARSRHLKRDRVAATTYYGLGDALTQAGCAAVAAEQYDRAVNLDSTRGASRSDWAKVSSCTTPLASIGYPWHLGARAEAEEKPCVLAASAAQASESAAVALAQSAP